MEDVNKVQKYNKPFQDPELNVRLEKIMKEFNIPYYVGHDIIKDQFRAYVDMVDYLYNTGNWLDYDRLRSYNIKKFCTFKPCSKHEHKRLVNNHVLGVIRKNKIKQAKTKTCVIKSEKYGHLFRGSE